MRGLAAALGTMLAGGAAVLAGAAPAEAKSSEEFTVGQWSGYVYSDDGNGQFVDCEIWTPVGAGNAQLGIAIPKDYSLELWLYSKSWSLPANQSYPISYWIDRNPQYRGRAETNAEKYVVMKVERDQAVYDELQAGNAVTFRTQDADYAFKLSSSRAALSRLLDCVDSHAKTASANPFGGGAAASDDSQQQNTAQQQANQQEDGQQTGQQSGGAASGGAAMARFTVTPAEVRDFLVDVTGAKPSMIAVEQKADADGAPYYEMKTPLGEGQFWQEKADGGDLAGIAGSYIEDYKKDCSGSFEPRINDPVRGAHGVLASGGAACSSSKYQDNGPEYLSYAVLESDGVRSFYMTYVGGNAAKAKTDGLGKLIARRAQQLIQ